ncbi:MAG TPA: M20/M25/M40 family metallo-hydrolase [Longimicrobiales bacterium]
MNAHFRRAGAAAVVALLLASPGGAQVAQERLDLDVVQRIRDEGLNRSQLEPMAQHLLDVIGPRLTGSHGMKQANEWTAAKMREWGLANVVVEPWGEFGRGWERVSFSGRILSPFVQPLDAMPVAWTGSTKGTVTGTAVIVQIDSSADLARYRGKLRNAFVLRAPAPYPGPEFNTSAIVRRFDVDSLLRPVQPPPAQPQRPQQQQPQQNNFQRMQALNAAFDSLAIREGVAAILSPSNWQYSVLRVGGGSGRNLDRPIPPPALVVSIEQYGQIYRNVQRGVPVRIELNVQNQFHTADTKAYNTLADLPGTDKADELVMLGAHLDSWHAGQGATDNAAGSLVMMEAMRILKTLNVKPRRTIRIGLWSGEEQGLLGSRNWVESHKELWPRISAYVNVDNGTGKLRGIWDQSNEKAIPIFEQILWPFRDLGVVAVRHGNTGGTDHLSFDRVGIPGFNFIQDPIEYGLRTHHSNVDTYDHLLIEDLKQAAVVVASTVYALAMRDELVPRKPAPPAPATSTSSN